MKSVFLFFLVSFTFLKGFAQSDSAISAKSDSSHLAISIKSSFEGNSNTIPNSMISKILWGGFMSREFLSEIREGLNVNQNRFGFEFRNQASVSWKGKRNEWQAGLKYRELLGLSFPIDLFGLAFLGNRSYEGQSADLSNAKFQYIQYTGASFGIKKQIRGGKSGAIYAGVSALYGANYQTLKTRNTSLYTAPDGAYIVATGDMNLQYREPSLGFGLGLELNYTFNWNKNSLFVSVEDVGFIHWQKVTSFEGNSTATYKGTEIQNIRSFTGDSLFSDFSTRGFADRFGIKETQKSMTTLLPFALTARYDRVLINTKWKAILQVYYTYMPAYIPRFSAKLERSFASNWKVNAGLAYGGFGRENLLLGANKTFARNWSFNMETFFLGMAFLPKSSHGIGLSFGVRKGF
jgi:hypothetical protein